MRIQGRTGAGRIAARVMDSDPLKPTLTILTIAVASWLAVATGCTMASLERHTVAQAESAVDLRYREIMDNLAMIAYDRAALPSYASIYCGTIFVQDQGGLLSTTTFSLNTATEAINPSVNRQISQNWVLDPLTSPEKLEAVRGACQWAIAGPDGVYPSTMPLLIRPEQAPPGPYRHFGVADKLAQLPPDWLGKGCKNEVPKCACYKAHCHDVWVWVTPEGMKSFAEFTLIIQNIARVSINSRTLFNLPPVFNSIVVATADQDPTHRVSITAQIVVDQSEHLVTDTPYAPTRIDNEGKDSVLQSVVSAAGIATH